MGPLGCSDIGGGEVGKNLCLMPQGHTQAGLLTYRDGRTVKLLKVGDIDASKVDYAKLSGNYSITVAGPKNGDEAIVIPGVSAESIKITHDMQGAAFMDCNPKDDFAVLPADPKSPFTAKDYVAIKSLPNFANVPNSLYLCSNRENPGHLAVTLEPKLAANWKAGFQHLRDNCSAVLGEGSRDKCKIVKGAADIYAPKNPDHDSGLWKIGVVFTLVHFAGAFGTWGAKALWESMSSKNSEGTKPGGPGGGPGGGGKDVPETAKEEKVDKWNLVPETNQSFAKSVEIDGRGYGLPHYLEGLSGESYQSWADFERAAVAMQPSFSQSTLVSSSPAWERDGWFDESTKFNDGTHPLIDGELFPESRMEDHSTPTAIIDGKVVDLKAMGLDPSMAGGKYVSFPVEYANETRIEYTPIVDSAGVYDINGIPVSGPLEVSGEIDKTEVVTIAPTAPALNPYQSLLKDLGLKESSSLQDVAVKLRNTGRHPALLKELLFLSNMDSYDKYEPGEKIEVTHRVIKAYSEDPKNHDKYAYSKVGLDFSNDIKVRKGEATRKDERAKEVTRRIEAQERRDEERKEERRMVP